VASLKVLNGDHEVYLRVSKRVRLLLIAAVVALLAGGLGTTGDLFFEAIKLLFSSGVIP
jgi:hypothetical protein